jgi:hypothetical protein
MYEAIVLARHPCALYSQPRTVQGVFGSRRVLAPLTRDARGARSHGGLSPSSVYVPTVACTTPVEK